MLPPVRPHPGARASLQTHAPKKYSSPPCAAGSRAGAAASRAARSRDEPRAAGFRADGHIQAPRPPPAPGGRRLTLPPRPLVPFVAPLLILTICTACARVRACVPLAAGRAEAAAVESMLDRSRQKFWPAAAGSILPAAGRRCCAWPLRSSCGHRRQVAARLLAHRATEQHQLRAADRQAARGSRCAARTPPRRARAAVIVLLGLGYYVSGVLLANYRACASAGCCTAVLFGAVCVRKVFL